jgi:hypothetical protein
MTKKTPPVEWPYIFFGAAKRNNDGSFLPGTKIPLKVYNIEEAKAVRWTFDDEPIQVEGDCYYTLPHSGVLKAHIFWEDGRVEILMKEMTISPAI